MIKVGKNIILLLLLLTIGTNAIASRTIVNPSHTQGSFLNPLNSTICYTGNNVEQDESDTFYIYADHTINQKGFHKTIGPWVQTNIKITPEDKADNKVYHVLVDGEINVCNPVEKKVSIHASLCQDNTEPHYDKVNLSNGTIAWDDFCPNVKALSTKSHYTDSGISLYPGDTVMFKPTSKEINFGTCTNPNPHIGLSSSYKNKDNVAVPMGKICDGSEQAFKDFATPLANQKLIASIANNDFGPAGNKVGRNYESTIAGRNIGNDKGLDYFTVRNIPSSITSNDKSFDVFYKKINAINTLRDQFNHYTGMLRMQAGSARGSYSDPHARTKAVSALDAVFNNFFDMSSQQNLHNYLYYPGMVYRESSIIFNLIHLNYPIDVFFQNSATDFFNKLDSIPATSRMAKWLDILENLKILEEYYATGYLRHGYYHKLNEKYNQMVQTEQIEIGGRTYGRDKIMSLLNTIHDVFPAMRTINTNDPEALTYGTTDNLNKAIKAFQALHFDTLEVAQTITDAQNAIAGYDPAFNNHSPTKEFYCKLSNASLSFRKRMYIEAGTIKRIPQIPGGHDVKTLSADELNIAKILLERFLKAFPSIGSHQYHENIKAIHRISANSSKVHTALNHVDLSMFNTTVTKYIGNKMVETIRNKIQDITTDQLMINNSDKINERNLKAFWAYHYLCDLFEDILVEAQTGEGKPQINAIKLFSFLEKGSDLDMRSYTPDINGYNCSGLTGNNSKFIGEPLLSINKRCGKLCRYLDPGLLTTSASEQCIWTIDDSPFRNITPQQMQSIPAMERTAEAVTADNLVAAIGNDLNLNSKYCLNNYKKNQDCTKLFQSSDSEDKRLHFFKQYTVPEDGSTSGGKLMFTILSDNDHYDTMYGGYSLTVTPNCLRDRGEDLYLYIGNNPEHVKPGDANTLHINSPTTIINSRTVNDFGYIHLAVIKRHGRTDADMFGSYNVTIKQTPPQLFFSKWADAIIDVINDKLHGKVKNNQREGGYAKIMFSSLARQMSSLIGAVISLYIMFIGVGYMAGTVALSKEHLAKNIIRIAIILQLTSQNSWEFFNVHFFEWLRQIMITFINLLGNPRLSATGISQFDEYQSFVFFDGILRIFTSSKLWLRVAAISVSGIFGFIVACYVIYAMFMIFKACMYGLLLYTMSLLGLALMFALAPFFITTMLFEITRKMFEAWMKQIISYIAQPVFYFATLAVLIEIILQIMETQFNYNICTHCLMRIYMLFPPLQFCILKFLMPIEYILHLDSLLIYNILPTMFGDADTSSLPPPQNVAQTGESASGFLFSIPIDLATLVMLIITVRAMKNFAGVANTMASSLVGFSPAIQNLNVPAGQASESLKSTIGMDRESINRRRESKKMASRAGAKARADAARDDPDTGKASKDRKSDNKRKTVKKGPGATSVSLSPLQRRDGNNQTDGD